MAGLKQFSNSSNNSSSLLAMNVPLDNFASSPISRVQESNILAVCIADEASRGTNCYVYSTCLSGSRACELRRQAGVSEVETSSFVTEMKKSRASTHDDAVHPPKTMMNRLDKPEKELKDVKIDATLMITSNDQNMNTWFGFVSEGALYLKGNGWDSTDIRESVVAALDLAEEQLGCQTLYLCLEKSNPNLANLVRTLMYAGFEMVHPSVLPDADPKYLVLGMDI